MTKSKQIVWGALFAVFAVVGWLYGPSLVRAEWVPENLADHQVVNLAQQPSSSSQAIYIRYSGWQEFGPIAYGEHTIESKQQIPELQVELAEDPTFTNLYVNQAVPLESMENHALILYGDEAANGWQTGQIKAIGPAPDGSAFLRFGHVATASEAWNAQTIDVRGPGGTVYADDIAVGDIQTAPLALPAGNVDFLITSADGNEIILDLAPLTLRSGGSSMILLVGNDAENPIAAYMLDEGEWGFSGSFLDLAPAGGSAYFTQLGIVNGSVSLKVDGEVVGNGLDFGGAVPYLSLSAGKRSVEIVDDLSGAVLFSGTVLVEADKRYAAIASGNANGYPLEIKVIDENPTPDGRAPQNNIRIGHFAPFATPLAATTLNLCTVDRLLLADGLEFGTFNPEFNIGLEAGPREFMLSTDGCASPVQAFEPVELVDDELVTFYITGDGILQPLGLYMIRNREPGFFLTPAEIPVPDLTSAYVAHLSSFSAAPTADIIVSGRITETISNVNLGDSVPNLAVEVGTQDFIMQAVNEPLSATLPGVTMSQDEDVTLLVIGDNSSTPVEWIRLVDDNTPPAGDLAKIRFGNLVSFSGSPSTTEVDLCLQDNTPLITGIEFGEIDNTYSVLLPSGTYDLKVSNAGCVGEIIDPEPITVSAGDVVSLFAAGSTANATTALYAIFNGEAGFFIPEAGPVRLYWANLAPLADGATVSMFSPGRIGFTLAYAGSNGYFETTPAFEYTFIATPSDPAISPISTTTTLSVSNDYSTIVIGDGINQPFQILNQVDGNTASTAGFGKMRFGNLAPTSADLAETVIDIRTQDDLVLADDLEFGEISGDFVEFSAGTYNIKITTADGATTLFDPGPFTLEDQDRFSLYYTGNGTTSPFGVFVIPTEEFGYFLDTEEPGGVVQVANLVTFSGYPDLDSTINNDTLITDLEFATLSSFVAVPAGSGSVQMNPSESRLPDMATETTFEDDHRYISILFGDGSAETPLEVLMLDLESPPIFRSSLYVGHTDPRMPQTIDVRLSNGQILIDDLEYGEIDSIILWPGTYSIELTTADGGETLLNIPSVSFFENEAVAVFSATRSVGGPSEPLVIHHPYLPIGPDGPRVKFSNLLPFIRR